MTRPGKTDGTDGADVRGTGSAKATAWLDQQVRELKRGNPDQVLATLARLPASTTETQATRDGVIAYLVKRRPQIAYADFRAAGYRRGSAREVRLFSNRQRE